MKDFSVKVPGTNFTLSSNSIYRIEGKVSTSSPKEFQDAGFTKIPEPIGYQAGEQVKVKFDVRRKIWDTGFYENSPCYINNRIPKEEVKKTVETLKKHLIPELEEMLEEGALSQKSSNSYFDEYTYYVNQKSTYTTNTPLDFWGLCNALLDYVVAPIDEVNRPIYRNDMIGTPFVIYDGVEEKNQKQDNVFEKTKATTTFMMMWTSDKVSDKELLIDVSNYIGFKLSSKTKDKVAISQFDNWITNTQDAKQNIKDFNNKIEYFSKAKNKEELALYKQVKRALKEGIITLVREELFLNGESLGMSSKIAAQRLNANKALKKNLLELMS